MGIDAEYRRLVTGQNGARGPAYGRVAVALHWLAAGLILAAFGIGAAMVRIGAPLPVAFALFDLHKSLGVTLLGVMVLRLVWRWSNPPAPLPLTFSAQEARGARAGHALLYAAFIVLPLTGWAMATVSALGLPLVWFGVAEIPGLPLLGSLPLHTRARLEPWAMLLHKSLAWFGLCLVAAHVMLVWWHARAGREVLSRMWWRR